MLGLLVCLVGLPTSTTATATATDDLIIIIDEESQGDGIIREEPSVPEVDPWDVRARASIELDARVGVDTSFDRRGEHVGELWLGARLELDVDLARGLSVFAAPTFDYVTAIDREGEDRQFLYLLTPEAYVAWADGPFVFRAGALIFSWGPSDIIGPNDVLNPVDYRRSILGISEDAKIPVLAAEGGATFGPFTLKAVVQPFFTASRFHIQKWDFSALQAGVFPLSDRFPVEQFFSEAQVDELGSQALGTERPSSRPDNATIAGRAALTFGTFDIAFNAVYGWDTLPSFIVDDDLVFLANTFAETNAAGEPFPFTDQEVLSAVERLRDAVDGGRKIIKGTYLRRTVLGFDAVAALDPIVLKVDVAYSLQHTVYTQALLPKAHPWLNAVLGLEYFDGSRLQVIAELFAFAVFDVPGDYRLLFFEETGAPPGENRTVFFPGIAGAVRYTILNGDLRFELGVSATLRGDLLILPTVQYKVGDMHRFMIGGMAVEGREGSYGHSYTNTDQVYVAYRWSY